MSQKTTVLVAALDAELDSIMGELDVEATHSRYPGLIYQGHLGKQQIFILRSGMGLEAMRRSLQALIELVTPDQILLIGFSGACTPELQVGDFFVPREVFDQANEKTYCLSDKQIDLLDLLKSKQLRVHEGRLLTLTHFLGDAHQKAFFGTKFQAQAIDMESAELVKFCAEKNIPCLVLRVVFDVLEFSLPDLTSTMTMEGKIKPLEFLRHFVKHPRDLWSLGKMIYAHHKAKESLREFLHAWFKLGV